MFRVTRFRTDPALGERLVRSFRETMHCMRSNGIRSLLVYGRQAFNVDGRFKFWGGGEGLVDAHTKVAKETGIEIRYDTRAIELLTDGPAVTEVKVRHKGLLEEDPRELG